MDKKELSKWGNSVSVRIPYRILDTLDWKAGDEIEMEVFKSSLVLKKNIGDTSEDILKTLSVTLNYLIELKKHGISAEVERELLETIRFGLSALIEGDEFDILMLAQSAVNISVENLHSK